jgi:hypothetical protein
VLVGYIPSIGAPLLSKAGKCHTFDEFRGWWATQKKGNAGRALPFCDLPEAGGVGGRHEIRAAT